MAGYGKGKLGKMMGLLGKRKTKAGKMAHAFMKGYSGK